MIGALSGPSGYIDGRMTHPAGAIPGEPAGCYFPGAFTDCG